MEIGIHPVELTWLRNKPQEFVGGLLAGVLVSDLCSVTVAAQPHPVPHKVILARVEACKVTVNNS